MQKNSTFVRKLEKWGVRLRDESRKDASLQDGTSAPIGKEYIIIKSLFI